MSIIIPNKYFVMATRRCNCKCDYCYASSDKRDLLKGTLETATNQIMQVAKDPLFMWYGGEPMLRGIDFFENVLALQQGEAKNLVQTNLSFQDPALLEFFITNRFGISTSIDGPKRIHDQRRRRCSGRSVFNDIMQNVDFLRERGYTPWAICVVSQTNVQYPEEVLGFFGAEGLNVRFSHITNAEITPQDYTQFMGRIKKHMQQYPALRISNFEKARQTVETGHPCECDNMPDCLANNLCVDVDGQIYPCNRFAGHTEYSMGSIEKGISPALQSSSAAMLKSRSTKLQCDNECSTCLNGGCMFNALVQTDSLFAVDEFCTANQTILKMADENE